LIGTRDIASASAVRAKVEEEIKDQLVQFRRYTGAFGVAAGWRERGYHGAGCSYSSGREFGFEGEGEGEGEGGVLNRAVGVEEMLAAGGGPGSGDREQFVTVSGWNSVEDYVRFRKLMVMAARGGGERMSASTGAVEVGRISPDVVGKSVVWGRRIA
jgi:hypothetical protein